MSQLFNFADQTGLEFLTQNDSAVKNLQLVQSPIHLEFNNKQTDRYLANILEEKMLENYEEKIQVENDLRQTIYNHLLDLPIQIDILGDLKIKQLVKLFEVTVVDDSESDLGSLINYIELMETVASSGLYVFINLKNYFLDDEVSEFYRYCIENEINILLVENKVGKIDLEKNFIIDEDSCEIY